MATTYIPLYTTTLASAASSVTISPISGAYTDLVLVASLTSAVDGAGLQFRFNGDTGSNYSNTFLEGSGSSATSNRQSNQTDIQLSFNVGNNSTNPSTSIVSFMNYSNSTTNKTLLARWNSASGGTYPGTSATVGLWRNTAPITSIEVFMGSGNINAGTTISLYGVAAWSGESTPKATGGNVFSDATYWYHAFPFSSTFTPNQSISADVLVIAGGGGGGGYWGAGGGAGGLLPFTSQSLTATNYNVTVGAGGAGGSGASGTVGGDSQFGALTLVKGGGYGGYGAVGGAGGSGGGGGYSYAGGSATSGQGYNGGSGASASLYATGGGGGANGTGGAASGGTAGSGGAGVNTYSTWATATGTGISGYYAGGGGGGGRTVNGNTSGAGGLGGGGAGGATGGSTSAANGTSGVSSTGGGGGGSLSDGTTYINGGNGGSGLVIVRYPI